MNSPLRIGIIGCGWIADSQHMPALRGMTGATVTACADVDSARLNAFADRHGIPASGRYTDMDRLLADAPIDIAAILTPPRLHVEMALAALQAGKHVFIEKPLTLSMDDGQRLIDAAARAECFTMVGFNLRFHAFTRQMQAALKSSGDLLFIQSHFTSALPSQADEHWRVQSGGGGGAVMDMGIHHFDLWRLLSGHEVNEVFAHGLYSESGDHTVNVSARMKNGVIASGVFSNRTTNHHTLHIGSSNGSVSADFYRFDGFMRTSAPNPVGGAGVWVKRGLDFAKTLPNGLSTMPKGGDFALAYQREWAHFIQSIQTNTPPTSTLEDGQRALQIALAVEKSLQQKQPMTLGNWTPITL